MEKNKIHGGCKDLNPWQFCKFRSKKLFFPADKRACRFMVDRVGKSSNTCRLSKEIHIPNIFAAFQLSAKIRFSNAEAQS